VFDIDLLVPIESEKLEPIANELIPFAHALKSSLGVYSASLTKT